MLHFVFVFDPVNTFWCLVCCCGSLTYLSFVIHLAFCAKGGFEFLLYNKAQDQSSFGTVWNEIIPLFLIFIWKENLNQSFLFQLIYVSVSLNFGFKVAGYVFLRPLINVCQPAAAVFFQAPSAPDDASNRWRCCFVFPFCSFKMEVCKWKGGLGKSCTPRQEQWPILVLVPVCSNYRRNGHKLYWYIQAYILLKQYSTNLALQSCNIVRFTIIHILLPKTWHLHYSQCNLTKKAHLLVLSNVALSC